MLGEGARLGGRPDRKLLELTRRNVEPSSGLSLSSRMIDAAQLGLLGSVETLAQRRSAMD